MIAKGRLDNSLVKTKDFKVGFIYGGTIIGDFFVDKVGKYWWNKCNGNIVKINPHPECLWHIKGESMDESMETQEETVNVSLRTKLAAILTGPYGSYIIAIAAIGDIVLVTAAIKFLVG